MRLLSQSVNEEGAVGLSETAGELELVEVGTGGGFWWISTECKLVRYCAQRTHISIKGIPRSVKKDIGKVDMGESHRLKALLDILTWH